MLACYTQACNKVGSGTTPVHSLFTRIEQSSRVALPQTPRLSTHIGISIVIVPIFFLWWQHLGRLHRSQASCPSSITYNHGHCTLQIIPCPLPPSPAPPCSQCILPLKEAAVSVTGANKSSAVNSRLNARRRAAGQSDSFQNHHHPNEFSSSQCLWQSRQL